MSTPASMFDAVFPAIPKLVEPLGFVEPSYHQANGFAPQPGLDPNLEPEVFYRNFNPS